MKSVSLNAVIFVFLISVFNTSSAEEWKQKRKAQKKEDIAVYMLKSTDKGVHVFKGIAHLPYPKEAIVSIVSEYKNMCRIVYQCKKTWPITIGEQNYTYIQLSGIWPAKGRDLVIKQLQTQPNTMSFTNVDGIVQKTQKYIRIVELDNTWVFTPAGDGWTKVELITRINPGGSVPSWLVNAVSVNAPVHTLKNVRKILDKQNSK